MLTSDFLPSLNLAHTLKVLFLLLILFLSYHLLVLLRTTLHNHRTARRHNCLPARPLPTWDPYFGLGLIRAFDKASKSHTALDYTRNSFDTLARHTLTFPIMRLHVIVTREPENVKTVLASRFEDYCVSALRDVMVPFVGKGIFVSDGIAWKHSRDVLRPVFTRAQIADMGILRGHAERFLERVRFDGSEVDLQPLFFDFTSDVATHVLFGRSIDKQVGNEEAVGFVGAYEMCLDYFMNGSDFEMWGLTSPWVNGAKRKFQRDCKLINGYVKNIVEEAMARKGRGDEEKGEQEDRYVLLEYLVQQGLEEEQVRAEVLNTFLAGRDTTASMLSDLWFELSKHQRVFKKLHAEIHRYVQDEQEVDYELIKSLPYLRATLNEILRIHPVVPEDSRMATEDTILPLGGGEDEQAPVFVPKGTMVSWSLYAMHRRKDIWGADAEEFRPERWIDGVDEDGNLVKGVRPGWAYVPFNGGPRVCVGQQFALLNASYVTIRLILSIDGLVSKDPLPWQEKINLTVTGLGGCKVGLIGKTGEKR